LEWKPKILIAGFSAYPRDLEYKKFRDIADSVGAYLLADICHISGLVATKQLADPFEYADVVTTTTHKSLRGPRAALCFARSELYPKIERAFNMTQAGPHYSKIAAIAA